jgi:hypothetical protein
VFAVAYAPQTINTNPDFERRILPLFVSGKTAARIVCLSPTGLYNAVRRGQIPATKTGRRLIVSIDALAERLGNEASKVQHLAAQLQRGEA